MAYRLPAALAQSFKCGLFKIALYFVFMPLLRLSWSLKPYFMPILLSKLALLLCLYAVFAILMLFCDKISFTAQSALAKNSLSFPFYLPLDPLRLFSQLFAKSLFVE